MGPRPAVSVAPAPPHMEHTGHQANARSSRKGPHGHIGHSRWVLNVDLVKEELPMVATEVA